MEYRAPEAEIERFGRYLRAKREARGLTLQAVQNLSRRLPHIVTKSNLCRIENGQAMPSFPRLCSLSRIYGEPITAMAERLEMCLEGADDLFDRKLESAPDDAMLEWRLGRVNGLLCKGHYAIAREECESMLAMPALPHRLRLDLLCKLIQCCCELDRPTVAKWAVAQARDELARGEHEPQIVARLARLQQDIQSRLRERGAAEVS